MEDSVRLAGIDRSFGEESVIRGVTQLVSHSIVSKLEIDL
jgi:hypothetical protein